MKTHYKVYLEGTGLIASCAFAAHAVLIHAQYAQATIKWGGFTLLKKGERDERPTDLMEFRRLRRLDERYARWRAPGTTPPSDLPFSS